MGNVLKRIVKYGEPAQARIYVMPGAVDAGKKDESEYWFTLIENREKEDEIRSMTNGLKPSNGEGLIKVDIAEKDLSPDKHTAYAKNDFTPRVFYFLLYRKRKGEKDYDKKPVYTYPEGYNNPGFFKGGEAANDENLITLDSGNTDASDKANREKLKDHRNYFLQLKVAKDTQLNRSLKEVVSAVMIGEKLEKEVTKEACICKRNNLVWGNKVSCEFRKKVVEIAQRLGKDPNFLMTAMALETRRTFSATAGKGSAHIGLIQFSKDSAELVGTTQEALLKMTNVEQLDYVEKYLDKKKDKLFTLADFYLQILMPVDIGKGSTPNYVVFDKDFPLVKSTTTKTGYTDLSYSRHYGYDNNKSFHKEKVESGKTYVWEIEEEAQNYLKEGKRFIDVLIESSY